MVQEYPLVPDAWEADLRSAQILGLVLSCTAGLGGVCRAEAPERSALGIQAGLAVPSGDLTVTTGTPPDVTAGIHADFAAGRQGRVRTLAELWFFPGARHHVEGPLAQTLDTTVRGQVLGAEYLHCFGKRFSLGGGAYLVRWSVASTNTFTLAKAGSSMEAGTSHWYRAGFGLGAALRLTPHLEAQVRWVTSHYGYENLPVGVVLGGVVWNF